MTGICCEGKFRVRSMNKHFGKLLRMELWKATHNTYFWITLCFGMACAFFSGLYTVDGYFQVKDQMEIISGNPMWGIVSLYNSWMGGESESMGYALFFFLIPLLAVFPYGWSYCVENRSGYQKLPILHGGRTEYFLAKYIAVFIAGGCVVTLPLLINFVGVACFVPAYQPSILYELYYPIRHGSLWSGLFYTNPLLFVVNYLLLDFAFAGLFAVMAYAISIFTKNKIAVLLLPYILVLILHNCRTFLQFRVYKEISPLHFLHATCIENRADTGIILLEMLVLFAISFGAIMYAGKGYEDL